MLNENESLVVNFFLRKVVPKRLCARWKQILFVKKARWAALDPYVLMRELAHVEQIGLSIDGLIHEYFGRDSTIVMRISFGHDVPRVDHIRVAMAFEKSPYGTLEGVVMSEKYAAIVTHEGELYLYRLHD